MAYYLVFSKGGYPWEEKTPCIIHLRQKSMWFVLSTWKLSPPSPSSGKMASRGICLSCFLVRLSSNGRIQKSWEFCFYGQFSFFFFRFWNIGHTENCFTRQIPIPPVCLLFDFWEKGDQDPVGETILTHLILIPLPSSAPSSMQVALIPTHLQHIKSAHLGKAHLS